MRTSELYRILQVPARFALSFRVNNAPRFGKVVLRRAAQYFLDFASAASAVLFACVLRFEGWPPSYLWKPMAIWAIFLAVLTPLAFALVGGYRSTWRHFNLTDLLRLIGAIAAFEVVLIALRLLIPGEVMGYSIAILWGAITLMFCGFVRILRMLDHKAVLGASGMERTLIVGTGETLAGAVRQLQAHGKSNVVGLVAEEDNLRRRRIAGVPVLGKPADLRKIVEDRRIRVIFLAAADMNCVPEITLLAQAFDLSLRILPSPEDLLDGSVRVNRHVTAEMMRPTVAQEKLPAVLACLKGRTVLVTGAGGSIGSELVRQVAALPSEKVVLFDQDENALFELLHELHNHPKLIPVIGDIRDRNAVRELFRDHTPHVVLHAAAYKHVPMMEHNPCEAVLNNVCGTKLLAEAAMLFGSERFVLISTDKAVQPSSIMGATKRTAEMVLQAQVSEGGRVEGVLSHDTYFACVRFGNVLGSRGSVLPLFQKQIAGGGPITVTHAEMTRYFMTVPQAVRLVLQASTLASNGDVYVLDMGDPVQMMRFAEEVVGQAGLVLNKDIFITEVGIRPGEKLHEQLWNDDAQISATEFNGVFRVLATPIRGSAFNGLITQLEEAARDRDAERVRKVLLALPIGYNPEQANASRSVLAAR